MTQTVTVVIDNVPIEVAFYDANTLEAQQKAIQASDSAETAVAAKDVALLAAVGLGPFADVDEGILETSDGQYFYTVSPANLYLNDAGNAVLTDELATLARSLGTMTPTIVPDNANIKQAIETLGENVEGEDGAGFVGLKQGGKVQHGIKYVTPEMQGAIGGGVVNDTAKLQDWIAEAAARGWELVIPKGFTYRQSGLIFPDNSVLKGEGTLIQTTDRLTMGNGCRFEGITLDGDEKTGATVGVKMQDVVDCVLSGMKFRKFSFNAITMSGVNGALVEYCEFDDIGDPEADGWFASSAGMAIYMQNSSNIRIQRNPLAKRIYGSAAYFIGTGSTDVRADHNLVRETFYRAFQVFGTGHRRIIIASNEAYKCGELNDTGSGIGCNGIYVASDRTDPSDIDIVSNVIEEVAENGIEVLCAARIALNKIKETGYRSLTTPSNEGIFADNGCIVEFNSVTDSAFHGIRSYADAVQISSLVIKQNTLTAITGDAINLQANGAGASYVNCHVAANHMMSFGGTYAVAMSGTSGGTVGTTNAVAHNIAGVGATAAIAAAARHYGNSWQV